MPRRTNKAAAHSAEVPASAILIGDKATAKLFARHPYTISKWRRDHGFPGAKLPGGEYAVTLFAIDAWLRSREKPPIDRVRDLLAQLTLQQRATLLLELTAEAENGR